MKKIILILLLCIPFSVYAKEEVKLFKCVDGDTAIFRINNKEEKVRFLAVDTPEITTNVEFYGKEAKEYTCNRLTNAKKLELEYDPKADKDKYDRVLAWVYVDDSLIQKEIIKDGYGSVAYIYDKYMYINELCDLQESAFNNKIGIWKEKTEVGYCSTKKNISKTKIDNIYVAIINNITYLITLVATLIFLIIVLVRKRRYHGKYKQNKRSRT